MIDCWVGKCLYFQSLPLTRFFLLCTQMGGLNGLVLFFDLSVVAGLGLELFEGAQVVLASLFVFSNDELGSRQFEVQFFCHFCEAKALIDHELDQMLAFLSGEEGTFNEILAYLRLLS